ncbi:MAG TPA: O-antigen ligase family protein, partial [Candidatus Sulfotelmatobacter sp.]|nr:O-antigen ligase family protein [Candidatus Sulfotelmatobacter sp.]
MKTGSSVASLPNPTPLLFLITAIAILAWPDAVGLTALIVMGSIAIPALVIWMGKSPPAAIIALLASSAAPRLFVEIAGLKARPEHIVSGLMVFVAIFLWKKRAEPVRWMKADLWLVVYIAFIFFSSILSIDPRQTIKWALQQVLAILPYFWLRLLVTDRERFRWAVRVLLAVGAVIAIYALVCCYSHIFFGTSFGVEVEQYGDVPATYGLQFEANILGAYGAALAIMMLVMYLEVRSRKYLWGFAFCGLVTMAISLSRAALGALCIVLLLAAFYAFRRGLLKSKVVFKLAAASLGAFLLVAPIVLEHFKERFSTIDVADPTADPNTLTRAVQTFSAFDEVAKHPVFGGGVSSFQLAFDWQSLGTGWQEQGWIGNTELRVLHDTGAVGLLVFLVFIVGLVYQAWKLLKREFSAELSALL